MDVIPATVRNYNKLPVSLAVSLSFLHVHARLVEKELGSLPV